MTPKEFEIWMKKTIYHRKQIEASEFVACYYCLKIYNSKEIKEWCDRGDTAICPKCGVDGVLPFDYSNHEEELKILKEANKIGFSRG